MTAMDEGAVPTTWWGLREYASANYGAAELKSLFGEKGFDYAKACRLVADCLVACGMGGPATVALDYFAGSGTTAHAVMNLNREDGGRRKFILVEMAEYFDTVLVPRIKKVMFTPEWKDGRPKRIATAEEAERTPRLVKVLRLESYEDALHNTYAEKNLEAGEERAAAVKKHATADAYRVRYMLRLPLDTSDSMVRMAALEHPWDATIEVLTDYGPTTSPVDLPETFLWLYGLRLRKTGTWTNAADATKREAEGRTYRYQTATDRQGNKTILVVWRDMTDLDVAKDRSFLEARSAELGTFAEMLVNGDTCAEGFASLDPLFRRWMDPAR
jgi:adenine-specific DNA-methyltransferase